MQKIKVAMLTLPVLVVGMAFPMTAQAKTWGTIRSAETVTADVSFVDRLTESFKKAVNKATVSTYVLDSGVRGKCTR